MALKTIREMVTNRLSFIPATGWETNIDDFRVEQSYYLASFIDKGALDVEEEASWAGMEKLLLAELTTYQLLIKKIVHTIGGDDTDKAGTGSKLIKKAKADVVEAEFEYAKAEDGRTLAVKAGQLVSELKESICRYSQALGITLPGFCKNIVKTNPEPPFIVLGG